jgi:hypothetical protein
MVENTTNSTAIIAVPVSEWNETKNQIARIAALVEENEDSKSEYLTPKKFAGCLKLGGQLLRGTK